MKPSAGNAGCPGRRGWCSCLLSQIVVALGGWLVRRKSEPYLYCILHPAVVASAFVMVVSVLTSHAASQMSPSGQSPTAQSLANNQTTILVTTIAGFLSTIVALIFQIWREGRNRRWDLEDRRLARQEADLKIESQTKELSRVAALEAQVTRARAAAVEAELRVQTARQHQAIQRTESVISEKIDANTRVTELAAEKAKLVDSKLEALSKVIADVRPGGRRITDRGGEDAG